MMSLSNKCYILPITTTNQLGQQTTVTYDIGGWPIRSKRSMSALERAIISR